MSETVPIGRPPTSTWLPFTSWPAFWNVAETSYPPPPSRNSSTATTTIAAAINTTAAIRASGEGPDGRVPVASTVCSGVQ